MKSHLIRGVFLLLVLCSGYASAQGMTFRGLTSASKTADVMKEFPSAIRKNNCKSGQTVQRSANGETLCETLELSDYVLDGTTYEASFMFDINGRLRYVSLIMQWGHPVLDIPPITTAELDSRFHSLADLISSKYGPATETPLPFFSLDKNDKKLEWQPGRGTRWQSGGDRIQISSSTIKEVEPSKVWAMLSVFYTFARREEFDRF